jgi:hypothetical protein
VLLVGDGEGAGDCEERERLSERRREICVRCAGVWIYFCFLG